LLSTIIDTIPDQICLKDTDSRYVLANRASMQALGAKSVEEMIGKTDLDYVRRDLALRLLAEEKEILESGKPSIGREMVRRDPTTGEISKCHLYTKVPVKDPGEKTIGLLVVNVDITQRKLDEERVRSSETRLRQLSAHLESVREEERKNIAHEFHDQLGQTLTALKMDLSLLERSIADEKKEISRASLIKEIQSSQGLIDRGIQTVRAIMSELRPELLDQLGLVEALEWEIGKFQQRSGVMCGLTADVGDLQFDARRSIALFRLVQEALTNVARHAQATRVDVIMRTEGNDLVLEVKDDGIGIATDAESKPRSFGLVGMRERVIFLGGKLEITGTTGKGTTIAVRMPIVLTLPDGGGGI
jgi:two-component system, NarL family, sensor histidine kinase UhpB